MNKKKMTSFLGILSIGLLFSCQTSQQNSIDDSLSTSSTTPSNPTYDLSTNILQIQQASSTVNITLYDNALANDLLSLLPQNSNITFLDEGYQLSLPRSLSMTDMRAGYDPSAYDVCYNSSSSSLVLYTEDADYSSQLAVIGQANQGATLQAGEATLSLQGSEEEPEEEPLTPTESLVYELNEDQTGYVVTDVGDNDFAIVIPETYNNLPVVEIQGLYSTGAFARKAITSVVLPNTIEIIGSNTFSNCTSLTSVTIPEDSNLIEIKNNAFSGCNLLQSLSFPASLTTIGNNVFNNCASLETITVDDNNTFYSDEGNNLIELSTMTLIRGTNTSTIPEGVKIIGDRAFRGVSLTSLHLPSSLEEIGTDILQDATNLTTLTIEESNAIFACQDNILYTKALDQIELVPEGLTGAITLPDALTSLPNYAFDGRTEVSSLSISANTSLSSIGFMAFRGLSLTIYFGGTTSQWESIPKNANWDRDAVSIQVICSDSE